MPKDEFSLVGKRKFAFGEERDALPSPKFSFCGAFAYVWHNFTCILAKAAVCAEFRRSRGITDIKRGRNHSCLFSLLG